MRSWALLSGVLILLNIVIGLWIESIGASRGWGWCEPLIGFVTVLHFASYLVVTTQIDQTPITRRTLLTCLLLATGGELILSAVWGLYSYRQSLLPVFVPPGHVLLFILGLRLTARLKRIEKPFIACVFSTALLWTAVQAVHGKDLISLGLLVILAVCLWFGRDRLLYAVMFLLALSLELLGTSLQSWTWASSTFGGNVSMANPPIAAGVFYAVLDLLTVGLSRAPQLRLKSPIVSINKALGPNTIESARGSQDQSREA